MMHGGMLNESVAMDHSQLANSEKIKFKVEIKRSDFEQSEEKFIDTF